MQYRSPSLGRDPTQSSLPTIGSGSAPRFANVLADRSLGGGSSTDYSIGPEGVERPYGQVGKIDLNLLNPQERAENAALAGYEEGGFFTGLLGAVGGTFGPTGSEVGRTIGGIIEAPLKLIGSVPVPLPSFKEERTEDVSLFQDITQPFQQGSVTLGGLFQSSLGALSLLGRAVERTYAGSEMRGPLPQDLEDLIAKGEITRDEALDRAVMRGQGFTNDWMHNLLLSIVTDPLNIATLGVGVVSKAATGAAKVERGLQAAGRLGETERLTASAARAAIARGDLPELRLGRLERLGLATAGRAPGFEGVLVPLANQVARFTDPLRIFGGGNIGKRSTEHLAMATSAGIINTYKPFVYRSIKQAMEQASPGGGEALDRAIGIMTTNYTLQFAVDDLAADAVRSSRIPFTIGDEGVALTPTEAAKALTGAGTYDVNIAKQIAVLAEKRKPFGAGLTPEQMAADTQRKLGEIVRAPASAFADMKVGYDEYALVHAAYYYEMGRRLVDEVRPALARVEGLPKDIVPDRLTIVGERTFTDQTLTALKTALDAQDVGEVRRIIRNFDDFDWINEGAVPATKNDDLLDAVQRWVQANEDSVLREVPLRDQTGVLRADLPEPLAQWADQAGLDGYRIALGPPADLAPAALFRITRDKAGRILNARPWLDFQSEVASVASPSRFQALRQALFSQTRAERILWTNRRRFVRNLSSPASRTPVPPAVADRIYRAILYEASDRGITARGLASDELYRIAKRVADDQGLVEFNLTEEALIRNLLIAFRGDISQVGLTQALTGTLKQRLPGARANYWGKLAERIYPQIKFSINPWFLGQEYTEPYILNLMRGVQTPLRREQRGFAEALAYRNAVNQLVRNSQGPEGAVLEMADYQVMLAHSSQEAHKAFGNGTVFSRMSSDLWGGVASRKAAAEGLQTKVVFGSRLREAVTKIRGQEYWNELERTYGTTDAGDIAFQWMADNFTIVDGNGVEMARMTDLVNPVNIGRATRISLNKRARGLTFDHLGKFLGRQADEAASKTAGDVLLDELRSGTLTYDDFITEATSAQVSRQLADRAYKLGSAKWSVDDFWAGYRKAFLKGVRGTKAKDREVEMARALVDVRAAAMGETTEEFLKTHFAAPPEFFTDAAQAQAHLDAAGTVLEMRQSLIADSLVKHGASFEQAVRAADEFAASGKGPVFRSRVGSMFLTPSAEAEGIRRSLMEELPPEVASGNMFDFLAVNDPDALRAAVGGMTPADARAVEKALQRADEVRARPLMEFRTPDGKVERYGGVTADHLVEQNLQWMDEAEGLAAGRWYIDMRERFRALFGDQDGPVMLAFALSQANTAPTDGMRNVLHVIERMFSDGFDAVKFGEGKVVGVKPREVVRATGRKVVTAQLNEANIVRALLRGEINGLKIERNFGAKLNDFLDSLLGNTTRRWMGRDAQALQPVAVDRWTARDVGLLDTKAISHLSEQYGRDAANGVREIVDLNGNVVLRLKGVPSERAGAWERWDLVNEQGQFVDRAGNVVEKPVNAADFLSAPESLHYEYGVRTINEVARRFNEQAVWGRTDWTAADVQAVGWIRMQKVMGGAEESPFDTFAANTRVVAAEVSAENGSDWARFVDQFNKLDPIQYRQVTAEMNTWLAQRIREEFGVTSIVTDWVGPARWKGGGQTLSAPSLWLGTPETMDDVADITALAFRQREVWAPHPVPISTFKAGVHHPVMDLTAAVPSGDYLAAEKRLTAIADALDAPGATVFKDGEGNLVLRIIDRPLPEFDIPEFFPRLADDVRDEAGKLVAKRGMVDRAGMNAKVEEAVRTAGLSPDDFVIDSWHSDVYIAGPTIRANALSEAQARLAATLDENGTIIPGMEEASRQANLDIAALRGGSIESGGAIKASGAEVSDLVWERSIEDTVARLARRGRTVEPDTLRRLRDEATTRLEEVLNGFDPGNTARRRRGDLLHEQRTGNVLGFTRSLDDNRVIIGALKGADPVTGLHELTHVFAKDLDESARQIVIQSRKTVLDSTRTDLTERIAALDAKASAARSTSAASRFRNQANALRNDLGSVVDDEAWGVEHEEFFVEQFQRWIKGGKAPTHALQGVFEHFRNWIDSVWSAVKGKTKGDEVSPEMQKLFEQMFSRPRQPSVNYNVEEQALRLAARQQLIEAQDEAFTTQYFKMGRSFAERTINHPFFGLYPFSYMFGKVLPEMFRFLALRPFGLVAPMLGWNVAREVSDSVRARTQLDPSVKDFLSDNADAFYAINSIFPAFPNDIPSVAPLWARRVAEQGLENRDRVEAGVAERPIDYMRGAGDSLEYMFGPAFTFKRAGEVVGGVGNIVRDVLGMPQPQEVFEGGQEVSRGVTEQVIAFASPEG